MIPQPLPVFVLQPLVQNVYLQRVPQRQRSHGHEDCEKDHGPEKRRKETATGFDEHSEPSHEAEAPQDAHSTKGFKSSGQLQQGDVL